MLGVSFMTIGHVQAICTHETFGETQKKKKFLKVPLPIDSHGNCVHQTSHLCCVSVLALFT